MQVRWHALAGVLNRDDDNSRCALITAADSYCPDGYRIAHFTSDLRPRVIFSAIGIPCLRRPCRAEAGGAGAKATSPAGTELTTEPDADGCPTDRGTSTEPNGPGRPARPARLLSGALLMWPFAMHIGVTTYRGRERHP